MDIDASTVKKTLLWLLLLPCLGGVGLGAWAILDDLSTHTDEWDGFGVLIGAVLAGTCLLLGVLAALSLALHRSHPAASTALGVTAGALVTAGSVALLTTTPWTLPTLVAGAALVLSTAVARPEGPRRHAAVSR